MTRCNACCEMVSSKLIAGSERYNTGGDTICLPCHVEATTSGWHQLPADAGQAVDVTYAVDWEGGTLYRRSHDRSDGSRSLEAAAITGGEFSPWNGILPTVGEWRAA